MNLHEIARGAVGAVNPPILATLLASTGYTTLPDGSRTPSYATPVQCEIQVQALTYNDIVQLDGMNIQGVRRAVYLNGQWNGVVRVGSEGGDLLTFNGQTWLVAMVLEGWDTPGWTKLAVVLQDGA